MLATAQETEELVVRVTAAVVADVEDQGFLVEVFGVQGANETIQPGLVHAGNVDIAQLPVAQLRHTTGIMLDPAVVHEFTHLVAIDGLDFHPLGLLGCRRLCSRAGGRRRRLQRQLHGLVHLGVEKFAEIRVLFQLHAVNGRDDVAGLELQAALVRRAALDDLGNLESRSLIAGIEKQAEVGRRLLRRQTVAGDPQVRGVELTEHQAHETVKILAHGDVGRGPSLFVLECQLLGEGPPALLEHLVEQVVAAHRHLGAERDAIGIGAC